MKPVATVFAVIVFCLLGATKALAQQAEVPAGGCAVAYQAGQEWRCDPPRHFAIGVTLLKEYGFGLALRVRANHIGFEAAGGYMPTIIFGEELEYFSTFEATGVLLIFFSGDERRTQHGLKLGYSLDTLLGAGPMFGYTVEWSSREHFVIAFGGGLRVFPQAQERIEEEKGGLVEASAGVQPFLGLNLHFYLI